MDLSYSIQRRNRGLNSYGLKFSVGICRLSSYGLKQISVHMANNRRLARARSWLAIRWHVMDFELATDLVRHRRGY